jgi:hypothetical protein
MKLTCEHSVKEGANRSRELYILLLWNGPITVAALSEPSNVFARSNTGIVGSNPTEGI